MNALHHGNSDQPAAAEAADPPFGVVLGTYVSLLLAPAVAGLVVMALDGNTVVAVVATLGAVVGLTAGGTWLATRARGLPARVGGSRLATGLPVLALCALVGYGVLAIADPFPDRLALLGVFTAGAAVLLSVFLARLSRTRHAAAVVAASTVTAEWTAGWPATRVRTVRNAALIGVVVGAPLLLTGLVTAFDWLLPVGHLGILAGTVAGGLGQRRTYRVTPAGLERSGSIHRVLYDWEGFTGYRDAGEALVIQRRSPLRPSFRCAWTEIEDPAAVRVALSEHVERDP